MLSDAGKRYFQQQRAAEAEGNGRVREQGSDAMPLPPEPQDVDDHHVGEWTPTGDKPTELARVTNVPPNPEPIDVDGESNETGVTHSGHLGMAIKLANQFGHTFRYVYGIGWHTWDGKRWAPDDNGAVQRAVHTVLRRDWAKAAKLTDPAEKAKRAKEIARYESASAINGIVAIAATLETFAVSIEDIDADPYLLNVANGTLDLRDVAAGPRPHNRADLITKVTRGAYHDDVVGDSWPRFLTEVLPDADVRDYLRRVCGVALLGKVIKHILTILAGVGRNGKGTFYEAVLFALGDYGSMADPELFMSRKGETSQGEMDLRGRRLVVVTESGRDVAIDEARMKRLTGGDRISGRYLYQLQTSFVPSHLPLMVTNHLPKVSGDDEAVWRRLRVVPFNVVIGEEDEDDDLAATLQAEADAILSWAVNGWNDYRDRGHKLDEPNAVQVRTAKYRTDSDDVGRFIKDRCLTGSPVNKATTSKLHDAYLRWAKQEGGEELTVKQFGSVLDRKGYSQGQRTTTGRWREGICLHPEGDE
jgi:putative DNA primase/helicase